MAAMFRIAQALSVLSRCHVLPSVTDGFRMVHLVPSSVQGLQLAGCVSTLSPLRLCIATPSSAFSGALWFYRHLRQHRTRYRVLLRRHLLSSSAGSSCKHCAQASKHKSEGPAPPALCGVCSADASTRFIKKPRHVGGNWLCTDEQPCCCSFLVGVEVFGGNRQTLLVYIHVGSAPRCCSCGSKGCVVHVQHVSSSVVCWIVCASVLTD
ncbi:hypothetical protein COO60DRAFT_1699297 [Scenedesmus sp. NREL 46B-D3]|nr:hypothetical protein COO60DRAFT_1699297 [Scenedesmus sp. NREL 46B-D3]